jgi:hypothetical protein
MENQDMQIGAILQRVETLQRENRRIRAMLGLVVVVGATLLLMGQARPNQRLEASEFALKDSAGRVRARLAMEVADRPTLTFYDKNGLAPASLAGGDEPFLVLNKVGSNEQVMLAANEGFWASVFMARRSGRDCRCRRAYRG